MQAGERDQLISIQRKTEVPDGAGGASVVWSEHVSNLWAKIVPQSGRESIRNGRLGAAAIYLVTVPAPLDVTVLDRVLWGGKVFNIVEAVQPTSRAMTMPILIEEFIQ